MNPNDTTAFITLVITIGVVSMFALLVRLRRHQSVGSADLKEISARLSHLEQAVDAISVETERIAEGQRFATKLLNERAGQPAKRE